MEVRAEDAATARSVAVLAARLLPRVQAVLPGARAAAPEIWVEPGFDAPAGSADPYSGFTLLDASLRPLRIHVLAGDPHLDWALTHELVHFLMGPEWRTLPGVLAEGVADHVAGRLLPASAPEIRAGRLLRASTWLREMPFRLELGLPLPGRDGIRWQRGGTPFRFTPATARRRLALEEILALDLWNLNRAKDEPDFPSYHGLGYLLVARIQERGGLEALFTLCREAAAEGLPVVPPARILAAAAVDPDDLAAAWEEEIHADDLARIASRRAPAVAALLLRFASGSPLVARMPADAWLAGARPTLALRCGGGEAVALATLPPLRAALREAWPWPPSSVP